MKNTFTTDNASILLIDHQVGTMKLAASNPYETVVHNTRALARAAIGTGMPLVLTSSQEENFQGLVDRRSENARARGIRGPYQAAWRDQLLEL